MGRAGIVRVVTAFALALVAGCTAPPAAVETARAAEPPPPVAMPASRPPPPSGAVSLLVEETKSYQVIEGFGATITEHFDLVTRRDLMGTLRPKVIEALFGQIRVSAGQLELSPYERFDAARYATANDDDDPGTFNWTAFNFVRSDGQKSGILDLARPYGFANFTLHAGTNVRWSDPWLAPIRQADYARYLEEMAENVVAPLVYWRDRLGVVPPRWHHLFNEPTTGNAELVPSRPQEVVDIVKAVGARLRREGFGHLRLVVASEETEEASLATARAILADPEARAYVGAISYHPYPYGSVYSEVGKILATSGQGWPDEGRLRVRGALRSLALRFGVQVWMTEVSHGGANAFDTLLGRAIHIHDELRYAGASTYWAMFSSWDAQAKRGTCDEDCLVHFDAARGTVRISGTGYAMGHYARWVRPGAVSLGARSDDRQVLLSAFRDEADVRIAAVVVNAKATPETVRLRTSRGLTPGEAPVGEQSTADGYWIPVAFLPADAEGNVTFTLPARSVTSLAFALR